MTSVCVHARAYVRCVQVYIKHVMYAGTRILFSGSLSRHVVNCENWAGEQAARWQLRMRVTVSSSYSAVEPIL